MNVTYDGKTITLEELAAKLCASYKDCDADNCPAAAYCRHRRNGMIYWLRKVVGEC